MTNCGRRTGECKAMADRIQEMPFIIKEGLEEAGSTKDWSHITDQIGMFAYTGLSKEQVQSRCRTVRRLLHR